MAPGGWTGVARRIDSSMTGAHIASTPRRAKPVVGAVSGFIAVALAAVNLRPAIAAVGAVLDEMMRDLNAPGVISGIITALPGACFALFGVAAVPLARRWSLSGVLVAAMVLEVCGQAVRPLSSSAWAFVALTAPVLVGIAVVNVLLPAWVKAAGGRHTVLWMTVYTTVLGLGSALGPLSPLLFPGSQPAAGGSGDQVWRWAVGVWAIPAAIQLVMWAWVHLRTALPAAPAAAATAGTSMWRSPLAVAIMFFFGLQSMNAYVQMGWLPKMLIDASVAPGTAAACLAVIGLLGIVGGLFVPTLIARVPHTGVLAIAFSCCTLAGYVGLILAPAAAPYLWATLLGIGGFCFVTALALIPQRTTTPLITARLSGFVQPVGYLLAAGGPFLVGVVFNATGTWRPILIGLAVSAVVMGAVGWKAGSPGNVDNQLAAHAD